MRFYFTIIYGSLQVELFIINMNILLGHIKLNFWGFI